MYLTTCTRLVLEGEWEREALWAETEGGEEDEASVYSQEDGKTTAFNITQRSKLLDKDAECPSLLQSLYSCLLTFF